MRAAGSSQWQDGYPAPGHISADIGRGCGYVLCRPGVRECRAIIAYGAVAFNGEPAYEALEGEWLTDGPYVVVHRMAVADGECGKGVAAEFLRLRLLESMAAGGDEMPLVIGLKYYGLYVLKSYEITHRQLHYGVTLSAEVQLALQEYN